MELFRKNYLDTTIIETQYSLFMFNVYRRIIELCNIVRLIKRLKVFFMFISVYQYNLNIIQMLKNYFVIY